MRIARGAVWILSGNARMTLSIQRGEFCPQGGDLFTQLTQNADLILKEIDFLRHAQRALRFLASITQIGQRQLEFERPLFATYH